MSNELNFNLLSGTQYANTPLYASFLGLRQTFAKHLGISSNIPIITHNNQKAILRKERNSSYPYAYILLSGLKVVRDQEPNKSIARRGSHISTQSATNATVAKGYLFKAEINFELHWLHNQITDVIMFIEKMSILGAIDAFTFNVTVPNVPEWVATVELPDGEIAIPRAELDDPAEPGAMDIAIQMVLKTRIGIVKDVPKVNNQGLVTQTVGVGNSSTGEIES